MFAFLLFLDLLRYFSDDDILLCNVGLGALGWLISLSLSSLQRFVSSCSSGFSTFSGILVLQASPRLVLFSFFPVFLGSLDLSVPRSVSIVITFFFYVLFLSIHSYLCSLTPIFG